MGCNNSTFDCLHNSHSFAFLLFCSPLSQCRHCRVAPKCGHTIQNWLNSHSNCQSFLNRKSLNSKTVSHWLTGPISSLLYYETLMREICTNPTQGMNQWVFLLHIIFNIQYSFSILISYLLHKIQIRRVAKWAKNTARNGFIAVYIQTPHITLSRLVRLSTGVILTVRVFLLILILGSFSATGWMSHWLIQFFSLYQ